MSDTKQSEVTTFIKWLYHEVNHNDLATLGPFRFKKEHKSHKRAIISPDQFLPKMAQMLKESTGKDSTLEDIAADFNELVDTGYITEWIGRTNKRIIQDTLSEYEKDNQTKV